MAIRPDFVNLGAGDVHAPAVNTAAVITRAAVPGSRHKIYRISASYNAAPTGGNLQITDGGTVVYSEDITAAGPFERKFDPPIAGNINSAVVITLAAAGAAVTGKLNVESLAL